MGTEFTLTPPIRVTGVAKQPLTQSLDVSDFDDVDALLSAIVLEGTTSPNATVKIITAMQNESEDGWVDLISFTSVTASQTYVKSQGRPLKFIRWQVSALNGTAPALTFTITGMLRDL